MAKTNAKEQSLLLDQDRKKSLNTIFLIALKSCQWKSFDIKVSDTKEILRFCCVHIPQLRGALGLCSDHMP